jgi:hypothetical protein
MEITNVAALIILRFLKKSEALKLRTQLIVAEVKIQITNYLALFLGND